MTTAMCICPKIGGEISVRIGRRYRPISFHVRSTAGDPGFVIDATWRHYNPLPAHYVLPRTDKLLSTLMLKDSRDHCPSECNAGPILLTDDGTSLRPGLHRCLIGTQYDWRCIYGRVPVPEDFRRESNWEIDQPLPGDLGEDRLAAPGFRGGKWSGPSAHAPIERQPMILSIRNLNASARDVAIHDGNLVFARPIALRYIRGSS